MTFAGTSGRHPMTGSFRTAAWRIGLILAVVAAGLALRAFGRPAGVPAPIVKYDGSALWAAMEVGRRPENKGRMIVAIIPSFAERYMSTALFEGLD